MNVWVCAQVGTIIEGAKHPEWRKTVRDCRFTGFLVETFDVTNPIDPEDVAKAKKILDELGCRTLSCCVAIGHPEGLDTPRFTYHEGWHIRRDIDGNEVRWCNAITPRLISDMRAHALELRELGIPAVLWDDDLRQGNYEGDVQGCFCDDCLAEFAEKYSSVIPDGFCRETLRPVVKRDPAGLSDAQLALREAWIEFTCERITRYMRETTVDGVRNGIMVMHNGDRRHGIDIPAIREAVPDCLFRVGELMFGDSSFNPPANRRALAEGVLRHMELMGDPDNIFSESTVYPHGALTPENLRRKIVIERKCGLRNINLMGMERMNSQAYYDMLRDNYDRFEAIEKELTLDNLDSFDFANIPE